MIWPWTAFLWIYFSICLTALLILIIAIACLIDAGCNNRFKVLSFVKVCLNENVFDTIKLNVFSLC